MSHSRKASKIKKARLRAALEFAKPLSLLVFLGLACIAWPYHGHRRPPKLDLACLLALGIYGILELITEPPSFSRISAKLMRALRGFTRKDK